MKTGIFLKPLQLMSFIIVSGSLWGQANVNLSNLSATAVNQHLLPGTNNNRNLGSAGKSWKDVFVDGNIYLDDIIFITNKNIVNNTFVGASAGNVTIGIANTGIGFQSMLFNTFGAYNTGVGQSALLSNTAGNFNSALGVNALYSNTDGSFNTACGYQALNYNTTGNSNTAIGLQALFSNTFATNNIAVGHKTLFSNTSGEQNSAVGAEALFSNTSGNFNTAEGFRSMYSNTTGYENTAIGNSALFSSTVAYQNVASGFQSLYSNISGSFNVANGYQALYNNISGGTNTAIGWQALYSNTGDSNTGVGTLALSSNTDGYKNTALGAYALNSNDLGVQNTSVGFTSLNYNTTGNSNTANGYESMRENTIGSNNTASGTASLYQNTTGYSNAAFGSGSLSFNTIGFSNTAIGAGALSTNLSGNYNTTLGFYANVFANNFTNATAIGNQAIVDASDKVRIGNTSVSSIGGQVSWTSFSDARIKDNVQENIPGLEFINELRPVTFHYNVNKEDALLGINDTIQADGKFDIEQMQFSGFLAQEVEAAANKIDYDFSGVDKSGNIMGLRYAEFVVPLVKAVQELDERNNELQSENEALKTRLDRLESLILNNSTGINRTEQDILLNSNTLSAKLEQNTPNPFNGTTAINYFVPENTYSAQIKINNNLGVEIKTLNIAHGKGTITLYASDIPSGNYSYSLIIDGRIIDTKNLIIVK